jgi:hypothetical protein
MLNEIKKEASEHSVDSLIELEQTIMSGIDSKQQQVPVKDIINQTKKFVS